MRRYKRFAAPILLLMGSSAVLKAQIATRVDLAASFLAERSIQANTSENFWAEGGSLELGADAFSGFGVAANVSGVHTASVGSGQSAAFPDHCNVWSPIPLAWRAPNLTLWRSLAWRGKWF